MNPAMVNHLKKKYLLLTCIIAMPLFLAFLKWFYGELSQSQAGNDFIAYWASARLLLNGQNPYLPESIFVLQSSVGWTGAWPLVMYNPPWVLTYILPFAIEDFVLGKFLWLLFLLICLFVSTDWLWRFYGGTEANRYWNLLILSSYTPVYFALVKGQIVPLILLGLAGFLHFERNKKGFLAGIFVSLLMIKPHVLYLFFTALFIWMFHERQWITLIGACCSAFIIMGIPCLQDPNVFYQYYAGVLNHSFQYYWNTPTLGYFLRVMFGTDKHYLQYVPAVLGFAWLFFHWTRHRQRWLWAEQLPLLIFMSLMTAVYVWVNDYVLLLVAILQAGLWLVCYHSRPHARWTIVIYVLINILAWVTAFVSSSEEWIVWMPPALFLIYLALRRSGNPLQIGMK